jgi:hypothetical protein
MSAAPFHWADPGTWPWVIYVWLAFMLAGWMIPGRRWLRCRRASGWPVVDGRIESVDVNKPNFSFTTKAWVLCHRTRILIFRCGEPKFRTLQARVSRATGS